MIRIEAQYAATDGSSPESIQIEWDDAAAAPSGVELCVLVEVLAKVARRYEIPGADPTHPAKETTP